MKILSVVGARPQFIKAAVVSRALKAADICEVMVHTGQHYDANMSAVFFTELDLSPPQHHLGISQLSHGAMTGRMLEQLEQLLQAEKPDYVLVYGDTNSTLAGALAAAKLDIPVAHVEAGLRSFNRQMPEEINRVLTDQLASLLFTTSLQASQNLHKEGIQQGVYQVGDVMYDAVLQFLPQAERISLTERFDLNSGSYGLVTLHRQENTATSESLSQWLRPLAELAEILPLVFPVHPRTRALLNQSFADWRPPGIQLLEPVSYFEMLALQRQARVILTDSGGLQKEAFYLRVPCLTLRAETEWVETVDLGWNHLLGAHPARLCEAAQRVLSAPAPVASQTVYGVGDAAVKIARCLQNV
ncbi:MAG: UDP-N-acetylglucosamine 2-epimerase (non-hydrolyzing) [Candidatus Sericytochromatia bacterium]|nr:UDP-N-acetylglucosamine 2-epimerase (non-hydrolyzing) [Candidatus Sericytochromatia bacterium]